MIFVIRHGERADDGIQNEVVPLDFDPPLTQKGIKQAQRSGSFIKKLIKENYLNGVLIVSSPFLRCLQTALSIQQNIDSKQKTIYTFFGLGEYYKENWFSRDVHQDLTLYTKKREIYLTDINFEEIPFEQVKQEYPEQLPQFFGRFAENYQRLKLHYLPQLLEQRIGLVLVTHGFLFQILIIQKDLEYMQFTIQNVNYCSVSIFSYKKELTTNEKQNQQMLGTHKNSLMPEIDTKYKAKMMLKNNIDHLIEASL